MTARSLGMARVIEQTLTKLGLDWQIILNKGALMVLPPGIDKTSGLLAALVELQLSPAQVIGVGEAENDEAFLHLCGCSVAVANALDPLKAQVHCVTPSGRGRGVEELIASLLKQDSAVLAITT